MSQKIGEKILARYHEEHLWPLFEQQRREGKCSTFGEFITKSILSQCRTELDLRNLLGISGGRISDIPELLREYSDKNPLPPDQVVAGTDKRLWWKCSKRIEKTGEICGYEWETTGDHRFRRGQGCRACAGKVATERNNLTVTHSELAKEYSSRNSLPAAQVVAGTNSKLWWKCPTCDYEWSAIGANRARGHGCPVCTGRVVTGFNGLAVTHPELAREYSSKNPLPPTQVVAGTRKSLWWICKTCGHEWEAVGYSRVGGSGCPACDGKVATRKNNLEITHPELAREYSSKNPLPVTQVVAGTEKILWWKCSQKIEKTGEICGHEWPARGYSRIQGHGCPQCGRRNVWETRRKNQQEKSTQT